uniref:Uncharacterized protein n=1 Tax=Romanomermis culicivorax TaxID=13658 RepID=A0A915KXH8_ROMCU
MPASCGGKHICSVANNCYFVHITGGDGIIILTSCSPFLPLVASNKQEMTGFFNSCKNFVISDANLTNKQLKRLSEHRYNVQNNSTIEPYLNIFWNKVVEHLPLWLSPNLITIAGFFVNLVSVFILLCYHHNQEPLPRWTFFLCALTIIVYQTLDGLDGKQARRTNSSSPLGELFDHGCDAFSQDLKIAHLTRSPLKVWDTAFCGPILIFLNQYYGEIFPSYYTLIVCLIYCSLSLLLFCVETVRQISQYLKLSCFRINVSRKIEEEKDCATLTLHPDKI